MPLLNQPTNVNMLGKTKFTFVLNRAPSIMFFCQKATVPSLSLSVTKQATPFQAVIRPGTKIEYEYYPVTFKVDEDLKNYLEIFNWMNDLGFTEDFSGYKDLEKSGQNQVSDSTLIIETSKNNPNIQVKFRDMFPVSLSDLEFNTDDEDITYHDVTATFAYQRFIVTPINSN